ncbi:MAG: hypothetical protein V2J89_14130 [Halieaceae bacterium]|nr:hypothetical protein [Halieaceae bacterium]
MLFLTSGQLLMASPASRQVPLSISFSEKQQIRSSMHWMQGSAKLLAVRQAIDASADVAPEFEGVSLVAASGESREGASPHLTLPYSVVGKLLYLKPDDSVATCSAALTGANDVVLTAAHCVLSPSGDWHRYFIFIKGYGMPRHEVFAVSCAAVANAWGSLSGVDAYAYDYAFLKLRRVNPGGSLGITNALPPRDLHLVGYSDNVLEGRRMLELNVRLDGMQGQLIRASRNPLRLGSSGMPWIASSIVHSVSSFYLPNEQFSMWGPLFTDHTFKLLDFVKAGCR